MIMGTNAMAAMIPGDRRLVEEFGGESGLLVVLVLSGEEIACMSADRPSAKRHWLIENWDLS